MRTTTTGFQNTNPLFPFPFPFPYFPIVPLISFLFPSQLPESFTGQTFPLSASLYSSSHSIPWITLLKTTLSLMAHISVQQSSIVGALAFQPSPSTSTIAQQRQQSISTLPAEPHAANAPSGSSVALHVDESGELTPHSQFKSCRMLNTLSPHQLDKYYGQSPSPQHKETVRNLADFSFCLSRQGPVRLEFERQLSVLSGEPMPDSELHDQEDEEHLVPYSFAQRMIDMDHRIS